MFIGQLLSLGRRRFSWWRILVAALALCTGLLTLPSGHAKPGAPTHPAPTSAPTAAPTPSARPTPPTPAPSVTPTPTSTTPVDPTTPPAPPAPTPPAPTPTTPPAPPSGDAALAAEVVRLVNVERSAAGCGPVVRNPVLDTVATAHSQDMADRNYFSHTTPEGRSRWDRLGSAGYSAGSGENIAAGQRTAADVMSSWLNSPGHRANILNCDSVAIGVGIGHGGSYGIYWTQVFGRS